MKVLWLINITLPKIADQMRLPASSYGGWLIGLSEDLLKVQEIELTVCFPLYGSNRIQWGQVGNLRYCSFPARSMINYDPEQEKYFVSILERETPALVHIFGTELPDALAMTRAFGHPERTLISIQGMVSVYAQHYFADLPLKERIFCTFRDLVKFDNIDRQAKKFIKRGEYEREAIRGVLHISGRTDWDKACTEQINPKARYHFCNETLRSSFYEHKWDLSRAEKYSIFISQASYPIKGFHYLLEALPEIIRRFPETHVYVGGSNPMGDGSLKSRLKRGRYAVYLEKTIRKHHLKEYITFTGVLNESEMCDRFLRSHAFVSPSSIENSPNSLCEAMILGVPAITSDVGGIKNLLIHGEEGFIYQHDAPYMLAHYVNRVFENRDIGERLSENARRRALITHDRSKNLKELLDIYSKICR